jgi:hypothetical protein
MLYVIETKGLYHKTFSIHNITICVIKKNTDKAEGSSTPSAFPLQPSRRSGNRKDLGIGPYTLSNRFLYIHHHVPINERG